MHKGLKCTVWTLIWVFLSQWEERLRNYSFLGTSPFFQGTMSIWTVYSKAISWTDVDYSFVIILSKELSVQLKQTIVRHQKQNKSIRGIAGTFGVAKSKEQFGKFWRKKNECTGELSNIKRPGRPRSTTIVDDQRILSIVKENTFTTSSQEKNSLQKADVSLSKSKIKRRLHQRKFRGFTTRWKKARLDFAKKTSTKPDQLL